MVLDANPENFFAETEQIAFHTANVVPGIDFTNDPLLQARNFSYLDTQLIRLGGPNFAQLPVNRPVAAVHHNQRDGYGQHDVHKGQTSYFKNSLGGGCPAIADAGTFSHYTEAVSGTKIRERSPSFKDHYSQAALFWHSMSDVEQEHIVAAFRFELGKVVDTGIRARVVTELNRVDHGLAARVAEGVGVPGPAERETPTPARTSPALSQLTSPAEGVATRKIAVLLADGADAIGVRKMSEALTAEGAVVELLAPADGEIAAGSGEPLTADRQLNTMASVLYDAVVVSGGQESVETLSQDGYAVHFVTEAYKHAKAIAASGSGVDLLRRAGVPSRLAENDKVVVDEGVVTTTATADAIPDEFASSFITEAGKHRAWQRRTESIPA